MVDHRKIPSTGCLEFLHHTVHLLVHIDICRSRLHEIIDVQGIILLGLEHFPADILKGHITLEMLARIKDWKDITLGISHNPNQFSQRSIYLDSPEIRLYQFICLQEGKDGLIAVVGEQFSPLGNSLRVD